MLFEDALAFGLWLLAFGLWVFELWPWCFIGERRPKASQVQSQKPKANGQRSKIQEVAITSLTESNILTRWFPLNAK
jgi:hypothetical protein